MYICICIGSWPKSERGFNINKAMLVENLEETSIKGQSNKAMLVENLEEISIKGQRLLYDYIASKSDTIHEFIIPKEVTLS